MSRLTAGLTPALADLAASRHGILTVADFVAHDLGRRARDRLLHDELLVPVFRGVYRLRTAPETLESRSCAISLADPDAFVTGCAGGRLWRLRRMGRFDDVEVRVPHFSHALDQPWVRLRRCNAVDPMDVVVRADGIRVASPPRLAFDLAADLTDLDLESVIEQLIDQQMCTARTLLDVGRRLYHPARPGSHRFLRVMDSRPPWLRPADSHLEVVLFDALRRRGVRPLERQHRIELPGGWPIHADVAVPELRWAIPVDHVTWHGGRISSSRDKQNDRLASQLGWTVNRVTDEDIDGRLEATVDELMAIYRRLRAA